jgi:hypothetical protein
VRILFRRCIEDLPQPAQLSDSQWIAWHRFDKL